MGKVKVMVRSVLVADFLAGDLRPEEAGHALDQTASWAQHPVGCLKGGLAPPRR